MPLLRRVEEPNKSGKNRNKTLTKPVYYSGDIGCIERSAKNLLSFPSDFFKKKNSRSVFSTFKELELDTHKEDPLYVPPNVQRVEFPSFSSSKSHSRFAKVNRSSISSMINFNHIALSHHNLQMMAEERKKRDSLRDKLLQYNYSLKSMNSKVHVRRLPKTKNSKKKKDLMIQRYNQSLLLKKKRCGVYEKCKRLIDLVRRRFNIKTLPQKHVSRVPVRLIIYANRVYPKGPPPASRYYAKGAIIDSKFIIAGGMSAERSEEIVEYDIVKNEWKSWEYEDSRLNRYGNSMVTLGKMLYIYGGVTKGGPRSSQIMLNEIIGLDIQERKMFYPRIIGSDRPAPRKFHSGCMVGRDMVIFGGVDNHQNVYGDLWCYNIDSFTWRKVKHAKALNVFLPERYAHSMIFVHRKSLKYIDILQKVDYSRKSKHKRSSGLQGLLIFGGILKTGCYSNRLLYVELGGRTESSISLDLLQTYGNVPPPRAHHSMTYVPGNCEAILYGGITESCYRDFGITCVNEAFVLNLKSLTWSKVRESLLSKERNPWVYGHAVAVDFNANIFIFGGFNSKNMVNAELWRVDIKSEKSLAKRGNSKILSSITRGVIEDSEDESSSSIDEPFVRMPATKLQDNSMIDSENQENNNYEMRETLPYI